MLYPGHGEAGPLNRIADEANRTLTTYRRLVADARPGAGGRSPTQVPTVAKQVMAELGDRPPVAEVPNLVEENVRAVARELAEPR